MKVSIKIAAIATLGMLAVGSVAFAETTPNTGAANASGISKERIQQLLMDLRSKQTMRKEGRMGTNTETMRGTLKELDGTCIQDLVGERDLKIYDAFSAFNTSMLSALGERRTSVFDAWGESEAKIRNAAIKDAYTEWKQDSSTAHRTLKSARKEAWDTFKADAKSECKVTVSSDEALERDSAGMIAL